MQLIQTSESSDSGLCYTSSIAAWLLIIVIVVSRALWELSAALNSFAYLHTFIDVQCSPHVLPFRSLAFHLILVEMKCTHASQRIRVHKRTLGKNVLPPFYFELETPPVHYKRVLHWFNIQTKTMWIFRSSSDSCWVWTYRMICSKHIQVVKTRLLLQSKLKLIFQEFGRLSGLFCEL